MNALTPRQPSIMDVFASMEAEANQQDPARPARIAEGKRQKALADERERHAIIARYGSEEAALTGGEAEQRLAAAVAHMRRDVQKRDANGTFAAATLDGWTLRLHQQSPAAGPRPHGGGTGHTAAGHDRRGGGRIPPLACTQ